MVDKSFTQRERFVEQWNGEVDDLLSVIMSLKISSLELRDDSNRTCSRVERQIELLKIYLNSIENQLLHNL